MTTLLIDADIMVYRAAAAVETSTDWGDGQVTYDADKSSGIQYIENRIKDLSNVFKFCDMVFCFSDEKNFRNHLYEDYKGNRKDLHRPILLKTLREYVENNYNCEERPFLEADDVMGILATQEDADEDTVIVTLDKDLYQIPVDVYNFVTDDISRAEDRDGVRLHMLQTLTGDKVDGYAGCPGIGHTKAIKIIDEPRKLEKYEHKFKRGPKKGTTEIRWKLGDPCSTWEAIVSYFEKAGLTEEDALVQARLAKILQNEDYTNGEIKLWEPTNYE